MVGELTGLTVILTGAGSNLTGDVMGILTGDVVGIWTGAGSNLTGDATGL